MKRLSLVLLACLLPGCQLPNPPARLAAQKVGQRVQRSDAELARYYPLEAGRSWTFELHQTTNDQDNTKFKTMTMFTEPLAPDAEAERVVLRRVYPDATITPTPSLARRFTERVELSLRVLPVRVVAGGAIHHAAASAEQKVARFPGVGGAAARMLAALPALPGEPVL